MTEKIDDELSLHEYEDEPNLHGMPETLSLLKNFRTKLKDDEIRRRELKKKVFISESIQTITQNTNFSTQTAAENVVKISPKMLLKLIFILMCLLAFVVIFVWYLSAFLNGRKNDDLSNLLLKEKMTEIQDLEKQIRECRYDYNNLLREIDQIKWQADATKSATSFDATSFVATSLMETWTWAKVMVSKWYSDFYLSLDATLLEIDNSTAKSDNKLFELAVGVMIAYLALFLFIVFLRTIPRWAAEYFLSGPLVCMIQIILTCYLLTIMIHSFNWIVQISPLISCASFFVMLVTAPMLEIISRGP